MADVGHFEKKNIFNVLPNKMAKIKNGPFFINVF